VPDFDGNDVLDLADITAGSVSLSYAQRAGCTWQMLPIKCRPLSLLKTQNAGKTPGFLGFRSFE